MKRSIAVAAIIAFGIPGAANAADMLIKAAKVQPVAAPVAYWNWSGLYAGAWAGIGVQRSHGTDPQRTVNPGLELDYTGSGFTGGGTLGYNWQFGPNIVVGVEGDVGYLGLDHEVVEYQDNNTIYNSKTSWLATARARIGWSNGPTLSYLTGGAAWVHFDDTNQNGTSLEKLTRSDTKGGYALGSGTETRLGGNWTAKAEYLFVDVGAGDILTNPGNGTIIQVDKHRYHLMKFGVNYLFGGTAQPPLPAGNWNGFYAGLVGGTGVTQGHAEGLDPADPHPGDLGSNGMGFTIGGIAGYNWQFAQRYVVGVEGDFSWLGIDHSEKNWDNPNILGVKTDWIGTARARLGYSTGPALLYVTGGGAWVNLRDSWESTGGGTSSSKTLCGFTVGGGIEAALLSNWLPGNWISRSEYLFVDVGNGDRLTAFSPSTDVVRVDHKFHLFRSALVYKF